MPLIGNAPNIVGLVGDLPAAASAPANLTAPVISGTLTVGQTLSVTPGTWTGSPSSYSYQWTRNGSDISGATGETYTLQVADDSTTVTCYVTATNGIGSSSPAMATGGGAVTSPGSSNQVAEFGASTAAGEGGWAPLDDSGSTVLISSIDSSSGMGAYTPSLSSGYLVFNATGAPDGGTLDLTLADASSITVTVSQVTGRSIRTDEGIATRIAAASLGDTILVRGYWATHNSNFGRATSPSGTFTGSNWINVKSHSTGEKFSADMIYISRSVAQYVSFEGVELPATLTGNASGHDAVIRVSAGSYVRFKDCNLYHVSDPGYDPIAGGARRGFFFYPGATSYITVDGCTLDLLWQGIYLGGHHHTIKNNVLRRIYVDGILSTEGHDSLVENNYIYDKRYAHRRANVLSVTRGNPTVFTVDTVSGFSASVNGGFVAGSWGTSLQHDLCDILSISGSTITLDIDSSGEPAFGGGDTLVFACEYGQHGDFFQIGIGSYAGCHDNITVRGLIGTREVGWEPLSDGQGVFWGDGTYGYDGCVIEGVMIQNTQLRGISIANATNCLIECCTAVRCIDLDGAKVADQTNIRIDAGSGNTIRSCVANHFSYPGDTTVSNNHTLALASPGYPVDSGDQTDYEAAFDNPIVGEIAIGSATAIAARFAPKTSGPLDQTIKIGAFPHYNPATGVYTSPYP